MPEMNASACETRLRNYTTQKAEGSTNIARPSRLVATMPTDNYMGGSSLHWKLAPLGRTDNLRAFFWRDALADVTALGSVIPANLALFRDALNRRVIKLSEWRAYVGRQQS